MLTSHLRATHDAAVKECVETDLSKSDLIQSFLMSLKMLVAACSWPLVVMQSDGNLNHWNRLRRCDHAGYSPPCGACEGVDGIASSDTAFDVKIFPCKIDASTVNPLRPL